jgi:putative transcriptional regulator
MTKSKHDWTALDAMTDDEVHAAALSDPDAQPMTDAELARMRRPSLARRIRHQLRLTRAEFAERYCISVETVRDRESPDTALDPVEVTLLKAIAANPDQVAEAQRD